MQGNYYLMVCVCVFGEYIIVWTDRQADTWNKPREGI